MKERRPGANREDRNRGAGFVRRRGVGAGRRRQEAVGARRRRGFTLIELTVFTAVGLIVVAGAWSFFSSSIRKGKATDKKVASLQANLLAARTLEQDLQALFEDAGHVPRFVKNPGAEARFEFFRYADLSPDTSWDPVPLEKVEYRFDARTKQITRRVGSGPAQFLHGLFERMNIRFLEPQPAVPGAPLPSSPAVVFSTVSTPRETLRKPLDQRDVRDRTALFASVLRERRAAEETYPFWNEIPWRP